MTDRIGFIYFLASEAQNAVKIGFAEDVGRRHAALKTGNPAELTLSEWLPATHEAEKALHRLLKPKRIVREWYVDPILGDMIHDTLADALLEKAMAEMAEIGSTEYDGNYNDHYLTPDDIKAVAAEIVECLTAVDEDAKALWA